MNGVREAEPRWLPVSWLGTWWRWCHSERKCRRRAGMGGKSNPGGAMEFQCTRNIQAGTLLMHM